MAYPKDGELEAEKIKDWLKANMEFKNLVQKMSADNFTTSDGVLRDAKIHKKLKSSLLTRSTFDNKVMKPYEDVLIMLFSGHYPTGDAKNYNHEFGDVFISTKKRFAKMKNKSVKFYALDIN